MNIIQNDDQRRRGRLLPRLALLTGVLLLPLSACDTESILQVEDPDIITPGSLTGDPGINAFYAGAIGDFTVSHEGGAGGGSFRDGYVTTSAYVSDEAYAAGTFPTRQEFDQRSIDDNNGTLAGVYNRMQRARRSLEVTAGLLAENDPSDRRISETLGLAAVVYNNFGEGFCSGVPFSSAPLGGDVEFGDPETTVQMFERAVARANEALAAGGANADTRNLARVQLGRALLNLARYDEAAQAVADVPTDFVYVMTHSTAAARAENGFYASNGFTRRLGVSDDEGGAEPPYAAADGVVNNDGEGLNFVSAEDPRVPTNFIDEAFDSTVPWTIELTAWPQYGISLGRTADFPVAGGIEARLIEAEAALQGGNPVGALLILNQLRAGSGLDLDPLLSVDRDTLFRERAFWLFAQGRRLGDLRRLVRQYGLSQSQVFPTGAYFKGGQYGDDVNLPIPQEEVNNPNFEQCLNRNA